QTRLVASVSATASRFIHAIIRTSPVSCCWAMAGTRPSASNATAARRALAAVSAIDLVMAVSRRKGSGGIAHAREAALEVLNEVADVVEPDVEAQRRPLGLPLGRRAVVAGIERQHEALVAAEAGADGEMLESVDEARHRGLVAGLEDDREQAGGAGEV